MTLKVQILNLHFHKMVQKFKKMQIHKVVTAHTFSDLADFSEFCTGALESEHLATDSSSRSKSEQSALVPQ